MTVYQICPVLFVRDYDGLFVTTSLVSDILNFVLFADDTIVYAVLVKIVLHCVTAYVRVFIFY